MIDIKQDDMGVVIKVRVQPRSSKNCLAGEFEGAIKVRLTAPPVDGAANAACCKFFAELFGIAKSNVEVLSGHTGRNKLLRINGISAKGAREVLG
ncbi:DUF167 domain-containing protein [Desulforamulus aquiferis]|uniref:UPF0235 protein P6N53_12075 n=1 Tax=Desulforamulus aquiferis TaxID=1397668 RepID=A0AAW7ZF71_9FIRM|nr:DUF167 domain-containing protein [Desulforamulus aquiferis]MDO7787959.1 DUF167 domain-containing protein [Desulforamulus aquiferis]